MQETSNYLIEIPRECMALNSIGINSMECDRIIGGGGSGGSGGTVNYVAKDGNAEFNKLFVVHAKLDKNFRGIFGGDNYVIWIMAAEGVLSHNPTADPNKTVSIADNRATAEIDRWAARKRKWRTVNAPLDLNWKPNEVEPVFGVVGEQMKHGGLKIEGKVKLENGWKFDILKKSWVVERKRGIEMSFKQDYKDKVLSSLTYERRQFFIENWRDADRNGVFNGLAIRKAGSGKRKTVYYTFDIDAYND